MNWWLAAFLSLIFTGACGTFAVNLICNHIADVYNAARWGIQDEKKTNLEWFAEEFAAVMLCGLTFSGLGCLIFSMIKLIGG